MSSRISAPPVRALPDRPSLEHLKHQARRRLRDLREHSASARLTEAQFLVARDYGFASWRELTAFVGCRRGAAEPFANQVGFYRYDPRLMTNAVVVVSAEDGRLFLEAVNGARFELSERPPGRFVIEGVEGHYTFEGAQAGPAVALVNHTPLSEVRFERVGSAEGQATRAVREQVQVAQSRPRTPIVLDADILHRYVGHFASPFGAAMEVVCEGARLLVQVTGQPQLEVFPESETCFFYRVVPAQLCFVLDGGRVPAVMLHQNGVVQRLDRVTAEAAERSAAHISEKLAEQERPRAVSHVDPHVLDRYVGRYRLDGMRTLTVSAEQGRLFIEITGQRRLEVYSESEQAFFWTVAAAQITFVTGPAERASDAVLHQNGRDVPLQRVDDERVGT